MWPVINLSALIGWNILSSLNVVTSTNERNQIYNPTESHHNGVCTKYINFLNVFQPEKIIIFTTIICRNRVTYCSIASLIIKKEWCYLNQLHCTGCYGCCLSSLSFITIPSLTDHEMECKTYPIVMIRCVASYHTISHHIYTSARTTRIFLVALDYCRDMEVRNS